MSSYTRKILGALRRRAEGAFFAIWIGALYVFWAPARHATSRGNPRRQQVLRRWRRLILYGFESFRRKWWVQLGFEPHLNLCRYILLMEISALRNDLEYAENSSVGEPGRIVVWQPGHMGDILHTVPMLRALRSAKPGAELVLITGPWNRDITERLSYIDRVLYHAPCWDSYIRGNRRLCRSARNEWRFHKEIREGGVDVLIDCSSGSVPSLFSLLALQPRTWIGPDVVPDGLYPVQGKYLAQDYDSGMYEARRLLNLLVPLDIGKDDAQPEFAVTSDDRMQAEAVLEGIEPGYDRPFAVIAPGAGWPGKQWMPERFAALGRQLIEQQKLDVFVIGTAAERGVSEMIAAAAGAGAYSLAGKTSVGTLAALLERCRLFIGNDSGPYHLAVAVGVPALMLFGPGFPSKWSRDDDRTKTIRHDVGCRCFPWHPASVCHNNQACMKAISVEEVYQAACDLMRRNARPPREITRAHSGM